MSQGTIHKYMNNIDQKIALGKMLEFCLGLERPDQQVAELDVSRPWYFDSDACLVSRVKPNANGIRDGRMQRM